MAGTFNEWDPESIPLEMDSLGTWSVILNLSQGHYEYKFIVDGRWCCNPALEDDEFLDDTCVPNAHGSFNRTLEVT